MNEPKRLKLRAEDAEDLAVISACLQDAVFAVGEMAFEPADKRFAAVFVRRRREGYIEDVNVPRPLDQAKAAIHFDTVSAVKLRGIDRGQPTRLMRLVGVFSEPGQSSVVVRLLFLDGGEVWLEADRLFCQFQDLEEPVSCAPCQPEAMP